jgi:hypothetical protein
MPTRVWTFRLLLVALGVAPLAAFAEEPFPLVDFTEHNGFPDGVYLLPDEDFGKYLKALYPRKEGACEGRGERVFAAQAAYGEFTDQNRPEMLITFASWTDCKREGQHGNLVIMDGDHIVLWDNKIEADEIDLVDKIEGNGLHQAVVSYGVSSEKGWLSEARTLSFAQGRIKTLDYISGTVQRSFCSGENGHEKREYAAIFYRTSANLIKQQNFTKPCLLQSGGVSRLSYKFYSSGPLTVE